MAEATGFEPAISALTGLHVRPLHHASSMFEHTNRLSLLSTTARVSGAGTVGQERAAPPVQCLGSSVSSNWNPAAPPTARAIPPATCSSRGQGDVGTLELEPHLAPFAATRVPGAGP